MPKLAVIFDIGGVLIDWNPRYLYRKLLPDAAEVENFLTEVCTDAWNYEQDRGRSTAEATRILSDEHPHLRELIAAYYDRWTEMLGGPIAGSVDILTRLREDQVPLYGLTNFSTETFPLALDRYEFLHWFTDTVVSGHEGVCKPDPAIYHTLLRRNGLQPTQCFFVDDRPENVLAAQNLGFRAHQFRNPDALASALRELGFRVG